MKITYFDYCAIIMFVIVLVSSVMRKMTRGRMNRFFLCMVIMCLITTIADVSAVCLDNLGPGNLIAKQITHTSYLFLHSLLTPVYIIYLTIQTDTVHKFKNSLLQQFTIMIPISLIAILLIVNCFEPVMFYFDDNQAYTRGALFGILYISAFLYIAYGVFYAVRYRTTINKRKWIALISVFPLMVIAVIIQLFFKELVIEMFANACGILFISMMIQRAEEYIVPELGVQKLSAYVSDMKRAFMNEKAIQIIMINIVNYKSLQEMLGYDATIDMKKVIADKMFVLNRKYGLNAEVYYLGDGKFRLVMVASSSDKVDFVARKINAFMKEELQLNQMDLNLISQICITRCPEDIGDVDSLLAFGNDLNEKQNTGEILYANEIYKKEHYDIMRDVDRIIEDALANHRFSVYYQPIYSVKEDKFQSAEALLRLKDEKYGFISPEIFIAAAEKSGAIYRIGDFVLEEVCKFISSERFKQLGLDYIEINLSVVQCMQNNLAAQILDVLNRYQVKPNQINLEITETAASYSQKTMMDNLIALSEAGIHFSLDDFGTGYSNMKRIASLPLYLVKLDKSFTDVEDNPRMMIVLKNTIQMIKAMNMQIVVEGVETENVVKQFADLQCEYIQGYYFSRPVPQDEFVEFIEQYIG